MEVVSHTGGFSGRGNFISVTWEAIVEWEKSKPGKEQKKPL